MSQNHLMILMIQTRFLEGRCRQSSVGKQLQFLLVNVNGAEGVESPGKQIVEHEERIFGEISE